MQKQRSGRNLVVAGAVALGVLGVGLYWWAASGTADDAPAARAVPVVVTPAFQDTWYDRVEALGTAMANESTTITANVSEIIREIHFTDGAEVRKDAVIATLEQAEEQAQLRAAQSQVQEHRRELARLEGLLASRAASQREVDERRTQLRIAEQTVEETQARLNDRTLRAPFSGALGIRRLSPGALMQPGDVLTTLDDTDPIKLDFTVPELALARLKPGVPLQARADALGEAGFMGEIATVDTRVDPVSRSVLVRALIPNPEGVLRPGMLMLVTLRLGERQGVSVPESALLQRQTRQYVMVVDPDTAQVAQREVTLGARRPGLAEITDGLQEGEQVIVRGLDAVRPGQTVTVREVWPGGDLPGAPRNAEAPPPTAAGNPS